MAQDWLEEELLLPSLEEEAPTRKSMLGAVIEKITRIGGLFRRRVAQVANTEKPAPEEPHREPPQEPEIQRNRFREWVLQNFETPALQAALINQCPAGEREKQYGLQLQKISFRTGEVDRLLQSFRKLEILNVSGSTFPDVTEFRYLDELSRLQSLDLSNTPVTDDVFGYLPQSLKTLNVAATHVTGRNKRMIREQCPRLRSLLWVNSECYLEPALGNFLSN